MRQKKDIVSDIDDDEIIIESEPKRDNEIKISFNKYISDKSLNKYRKAYLIAHFATEVKTETEWDQIMQQNL